MNKDNFSIRKNCIFCETNLVNTEYFKNDKITSGGVYLVDKNYSKKNMIEIPYNILVCNFCKTIQNKYLCNLDIVYKYSSSYGYGISYFNR